MLKPALPKCGIDALVYFAWQNMQRKSNFVRSTSEKLLKELSEMFEVHVNNITGNSRETKYVAIRYIYCYILRTKFGWTLHAIGDEIGRDHTTVVHACKTVRDRLQTMEPFFCGFYFQFLKDTKLLNV